jgi:hypothetical protein
MGHKEHPAHGALQELAPRGLRGISRLNGVDAHFDFVPHRNSVTPFGRHLV